MNNWNRVWKPIVVLSVICVVITGALAVTNSITAPIIEAAIIAAENAARQELAPEATSFEEITGVEAANVSSIYMGDNGEAVITSSGKGYGGDVVVMTAFTADGTIKQIKITQAAETKGIGSKVTEGKDYWTSYQGLEAKELVLGTDVNAITGATVSSKALLSAVNAATAAYNMIP